MNTSKFTFTLFFLLLFGCCFLASCKEGLEDDETNCANQSSLVKVAGTYNGNIIVGGNEEFEDFSFTITPSIDDCFQMGFRGDQTGRLFDFEGVLGNNQFVVNFESQAVRQFDWCGSYGQSKSINIITKGTISINEDKDPVELQLNSLNQRTVDENGVQLCILAYEGSVVKQ